MKILIPSHSGENGVSGSGMDNKSLSHVRWKCQVCKANLYHYSVHIQMIKEELYWLCVYCIFAHIIIGQ